MKASPNMGLKVVAPLACGAIALLSNLTPAQAFSFRVTSGIAGPSGETHLGAYSEFSNLSGTTTLDFNDGVLPTDGFVSYAFSNGTPQSSVRADQWAPTGANGEKNDSNYLAAFEGNDVIIDLTENLNYFGIDWGAAHSGNTYAFYRGDTLLQAFNTTDIEAAGGFDHYSQLHPGQGIGSDQGGQGNGYVHFYADSAADLFDRIIISQVGGGGFETDNHSFRAGDTGFTGFESIPQAVPEPSMVLGLLSVIGGALARRKTVA